MKRSDGPSEDDTARPDGGEPRPDGGASTDEGVTDRASAFLSESEYEMTRGDAMREWYDRKFYAPLRIILTDYRGILGVVTLLIYLLMGTVGVVLVPRPSQSGPVLLPWFQDLTYPLGTDPSGKGLFRMTVHATPRMLQMMLGGALFGTAMTVGMGTLAGFKRGMTDRILMTISDTGQNLPGTPLLLIIVAVLQPTNPFLVGVVLSIPGALGGGRGLRAQVLQIRNEDFVEAGRAMGMTTSRNIQFHILPELMPKITIGLMSGLKGVIYAAVGLYFLGILPGDFLNWGMMLQLSYQEVNMSTMKDFHYLMVPMIVISFFGFGTTFMAQAFDRVFNPRLRAKHAKTLVGGGNQDEESADRAAKEMMFR